AFVLRSVRSWLLLAAILLLVRRSGQSRPNHEPPAPLLLARAATILAADTDPCSTAKGTLPCRRTRKCASPLSAWASGPRLFRLNRGPPAPSCRQSAGARRGSRRSAATGRTSKPA